MRKGLGNLIGPPNAETAAEPNLHAGDFAAFELYRALVGGEHPRDQVEQRRFARPIGTEDAKHLASRNVEVEVLDHAQAAERPRNAGELEDRRFGRKMLSGRHGVWARKHHQIGCILPPTGMAGVVELSTLIRS